MIDHTLLREPGSTRKDGRRPRPFEVIRRLSLGTLFILWLVTLPASAQETVEATVEILPGVDIQTVVDTYPPGTTFVLKSGVHRLQTIRPRNGDRYMGETGTVLSGARQLTTFGRSGSYWMAAGQTQRIAHFDAPYMCPEDDQRCTFPEQLFIGDRKLDPVDALAKLVPGTFFFDYDAARIYFADDPAGQSVETSVTQMAFQPTADNVTISGMTIERYAGIGQQGAIHVTGRSGWVITGNEIRWNHGQGIRADNRTQVIQNNVHHNGQMGIAGSGDRVLLENNEIAYNNTANYEVTWEAAGTKFTGSTNLVVRGNHVHHNRGPGLWTDADNFDTLYENNLVEDNEWMGIIHEISDRAIIRNNVVRRNGFTFPDWLWGGGIFISSAANTEIYGNFVEGNADGITAIQQERGPEAAHQLTNLWVHDNVVANTEGWITGVAQDDDDPLVFSTKNNRFDYNTYYLRPLWQNGGPFAWANDYQTQDSWRAFGQDLHGTFVQY